MNDLKPAFFDPNFEPTITAKNPPPGMDILQASANNFYSGATSADLAKFTEHYPLNSRVVKTDGTLIEQVYRAGTPDKKIPPGVDADLSGQGQRVSGKGRRCR